MVKGYPNGVPRDVIYEGHCEVIKSYHEWAFELERDQECNVFIFEGRESEIIKWLKSTKTQDK